MISICLFRGAKSCQQMNKSNVSEIYRGDNLYITIYSDLNYAD